MLRRDLLRVVAGAAALQFLPDTSSALPALGATLHRSLSAGTRSAGTLTPPQLALVSQVCDRIIPATDTPGALDVRVPEFIDLVLTEWADDGDRDAFLAGLTSIDDKARAVGSAAFVELTDDKKVEVMKALDADRKAKEGSGKTFGQLKDLTVFAYFTSERVTKEVLKTRMYFSTYDGAAPVPA
jgi:hypothetical protein